MNNNYAQIVFPLPFRNAFTYSIPEHLKDLTQIGVRAVVPFGKRVLTGFVIGISDKTDIKEKIRPIQDILDDIPIFDESALKFYEWISEYYLSSLGEALKNSVPYGSDIESKKTVIGDKDKCEAEFKNQTKKNSATSKILLALSKKEKWTIAQLQKEVKKKNIYSNLKTLEKNGFVSVLETIQDPKVKVKTQKFARIIKDIDKVYSHLPEIEKRSPKQIVILLELLSKQHEDYLVSDLLKKLDANNSSLTSLQDKGLVNIFDKEVQRTFTEDYEEDNSEFSLTKEQTEIIEKISPDIINKEFNTFLIHGVTGSGKTQVYIELAKKTLAKKRNVIILVPEISLTPQITTRFINTFGNETAVFHSRMSIGERYDTWRNIIKGKYRIVIGPRSALFVPLKNIGLIVVDEEHDSSYKQYENVPKYQARDAAVIKAKLNNAVAVLGSATPSLESMHNAESGKYQLLKLTKRIDDAILPTVKLIDLKDELKKKKSEVIFSKILLEKINDRLSKKEGIIILQNRRGFSTQIYCADCGEIELCDNCSVSMVHHIDKNYLQCHYCNAVKSVPKGCRNCGSLSIKFFGTGTQRVEDELLYHFPEIKLERIDSDSITKKGKLSSILNQFKKGEIDLLVGTQMVSKGLDFSHVTLVGVISAETTLWLPDFRADERTFQLLTQVSGRAGRSKNPGEVIIQTVNKDHFVLKKVVNNDYLGFYEREMQLRKKHHYPPFIRLCLIETKDEKEENANGAIRDFHQYLKKYEKGLLISPPAEALIHMLKGQYRYHLLVRTSKKIDPSGRILREAVENAFIDFNKKSRFRDVKIQFDIDPQSVL
ncbi:MAG: primosomal protein N' [Melioribacteraceae bacterium]|nr:primosomal protein N' [Melioribacteraceae bacterium]